MQNLEQRAKIESACPLCGSTQRGTIQEEFGYKISRCQECGFVYTSTRFSTGDQNQWYEDHFSRYGNSINPSPIYQAYLSFIQREIGVSQGILDVGSGFGGFLKIVSDAGIPCAGVEINSQQRRLCQQEGLRVFSSIEEVSTEQPIDVVTLWAVLEHLQHPAGMLRLCLDILKSNGSVVVLVPNVNYALFKLKLTRLPIVGVVFNHFLRRYGLGMGVFAPMEHLNHFDVKSLNFALRQAGFTNIRSFTFDPIYVAPTLSSRTILEICQKAYTEINSTIALMSRKKLHLSRTLVMAGRK